MTRQDSSAEPWSDEPDPRPAPAPALRRELGFSQTAAVSVGVMAPTLAMSITGVAAAAVLGRAAPLAFVVAALGVGFVAYGFVRLAGEFSHAGSVYAFVGRTLGPRAGFVAGWALLGTYLVFPPMSMMGVAIFGRAFLTTTGLATIGVLSLLVMYMLTNVAAARHLGRRSPARSWPRPPACSSRDSCCITTSGRYLPRCTRSFRTWCWDGCSPGWSGSGGCAPLQQASGV